jgi:hypothetical protein
MLYPYITPDWEQADPDLYPLLSSTYFLLGRHFHGHYFTPLDFRPLLRCHLIP